MLLHAVILSLQYRVCKFTSFTLDVKVAHATEVSFYTKAFRLFLLSMTEDA